MSKIEVRFKNYKGLKNEFIELEKGFLFLIKGKGDIGKSSEEYGFLSLITAMDPTEIPLRIGEKEGELSLKNWIGPEGEKVSVTRIMQLNEKDVYTMEINGKKVTGVGKIRAMFGNHTPFNAIDFVKWSDNQPGKDKQREIILNLLTIKDKEKFFEFEKADKTLSDIRKDSKKRLDTATTLKEDSKITDEDEKLLKNDKASREGIIKLKQQVTDSNTNKLKREAIIKTSNDINKNFNDALELLDNIDEKTQELFDKLLVTINEKYDNDLKTIPEADDDTINKVKARIEAGEPIIKKLDSIKAKQENFKTYSDNVEKLIKEVNTDEENLKNSRDNKNEFMKTVDLPVNNLIIGTREEGLMYNQDGKILPFNEKQLSKTLIYKITIQIMANVNKDSGVIILGDAGHFDSEFKGQIADYAKENNLLILADEVTDDKEITLEIVEPKGKLNTKKSKKGPEVDKKKPEPNKDIKDSNSNETDKEEDEIEEGMLF